MIESTIAGRYRIEAELGRGGMGVVYRAHDNVLHREVAVKVLATAGLGASGRTRLMNEARAAAQLNHPHIVSVYDAGETMEPGSSGEAQPYVVMELVEGSTLHERPATELQEIIEVARQLCAALDHAHGKGIVHRDLKPENVIRVASGEPQEAGQIAIKLMDFGLARSLTTRMTSEGTILGTVQYLAPEIARGRDVDGRSDLYALGVLLYELTTGELPFSADDPVALISQHLHAPVVPPRSRKPEVPAALNMLIVDLLAKKPEDRPATASDVLARLDGLAAAGQEPEQVPQLSLLQRIVRGRLVGRQSELAEARAVWTRAAAGAGQTLLISGEPGIGKSRLARELATQAEVTGGRVLVGSSYAEGGLPYDPLAQILRQTLGPEARNGFVPAGHVLADLLTLLPDLQAQYSEVKANPPLDPEGEQRRLYESLVAYYRGLAEKSPLLLVFEDAHWADGGTLAALRHIVRRLTDLRLLVAITYREVELEGSPPLRELLAELNRERLATRIKLTRLDRQGTHDLLATIFDEEITPDFLESIYNETEGNPFFVEEVCKALVEGGNLTFEGGHWHRPEMIEIEIPQSVRTAVGGRLERLSRDCRQALTQASVIGQEFEFDVLLALSGLDEDRLLDLIDEALAAQLIVELDRDALDRYAFAHALIGHTLYDSLNRRRQARLHEQVGQALETFYAANLEPHLARLAYHFYHGARGFEVDKAVDYCRKAAEQAYAVYAYLEAVRFLEQAIELLEEAGREADTMSLWERLGDVHERAISRAETASSYGTAVRILESLPADAVSKADAVRLYIKIGAATRWGASPPQALDYVKKGLALVADDGPTLERARLLTAFSFASHFDAYNPDPDPIGARKAAEEAVEIFERLDDPDWLSTALDALGSTYNWEGDVGRAMATTGRRLRLLDRLDRREWTDVVHMAGRYSIDVGDYAEAEPHIKEILKNSVEQRNISWQLGKLWDMVLLYVGWNRWEEALAAIERFVLLATETGGRYWSANVSVPVLSRIAAAIADLIDRPELASDTMAAAEPIALDEQANLVSWRVATERQRLAYLLIGMKRYEEAQETIEDLLAMQLNRADRLGADVMSAALAAGRGEPEALDKAISAEASVAGTGNRPLIALAVQALGLAYLQVKELNLAREKLEQALSAFQELEMSWEQGRTLQMLGRLARLRGEDAEAEGYLRQARETFEANGVAKSYWQ